MTTIKSTGRGFALLACFALLAGSALAQTQPELEQRGERWYLPGSETPYTGPVEKPGRMTGQYADGRPDGEWVWKAPAGYTEYLLVYADGLRVRSAGWHPNGQQEMARTYVAGKTDGLAQDWDRHGTLRTEAMYRAGTQHGSYRVWDQDGHLLYTAEYRDGTLDGTATWWYGNGQKRWETHFADGERTGTWSQWDPDGSLRMQSTWADGTLVSRHNPHADH